MNCNIIRDLIPLYIDGCCSEESREEIKKHLECCRECKSFYEEMDAPVEVQKTAFAPKPSHKINQWKASVLQSVLFLFSFLLITVGVYFEAQSPSYDYFGNGLVAFNTVVPATAFMLSLTNWFFVRLYKNKKIFSWSSCAIMLAIAVCATLWTSHHYEFSFIEAFKGAAFIDVAESVCFLFGTGIALTAVFAAAAKILSDFYARLVGKE